MSGAKRRRVDTASGNLPGYFESLQDSKCKKRYKEKLEEYLGGVDPYELPIMDWEDDVDLWPEVSYVDVGMYLLFSSSAYTQDQLKDYKNLDCYKKFISGWVREVAVKKVGDKRVALMAKVNHSQRLSEKPLVPWVVCEETGRVLAAHCNCMAGLGESCSHVAALLWAAEAGAKKRESLTVTDKKAYWVLPGSVSKAEPKPLRSIRFSAATNKVKPKHHIPVEGPSQEELDSMFESLSECGSKPAILSLIEPYAERYIPHSLDSALPQLLGGLFEKDNLQLHYQELVDLGVTKMKLYDVTEEERNVAEQKTRKQAGSSVWFSLRAGRVTASRLKAVCCTKTTKPAMSLLMGVCYPELRKFRAQATQWGCNHEVKGIAAYNALQKEQHVEFKTEACGLFIDLEHGFLAATPDSLVSCSCCGDGVLEIKCPFCHKDDTSPLPLMNNSMFTKEVDTDGKCVRTQLKRDHAYYYQVQAQLLCTGKAYCDLLVWTPASVYLERITPDQLFIANKIQLARNFVTLCVMPELLGRWYTRPVVKEKENTNPADAISEPGASETEATAGGQTPVADLLNASLAAAGPRSVTVTAAGPRPAVAAAVAGQRPAVAAAAAGPRSVTVTAAGPRSAVAATAAGPRSVTVTTAGPRPAVVVAAAGQRPAVVVTAAGPRPAVAAAAAGPRSVTVTTAGPRPAVVVAAAGQRPAVVVTAAGPRPAVAAAAAGPRPAVVVTAAGPRPAVVVAAAGPRPAVAAAASGPRPAVVVTAAGPRPAVVVTAAGPRPAVVVAAAGPRSSVAAAGPRPVAAATGSRTVMVLAEPRPVTAAVEKVSTQDGSPSVPETNPADRSITVYVQGKAVRFRIAK